VSSPLKKLITNSRLHLALGILGGPDLFIILLIVLVLFGAKKLPELARSLGQSMTEFRKVHEEFDRELHNASNDLKGQPKTYQPAQPAVPAPQPPPAVVANDQGPAG
jgi:sec-independent protein translocase protein TatA